MKPLERSNPFVPVICMICITLTAAFCQYPGIVIPGLLGGVTFFSLVAGKKGKTTHFACALLFIASTVVNPLVSHNGVTVLFFLNDRPITLEAVFVGASNGAVMAEVIYYFACLTRIMTSDKLLYVFGKVSPKSALILSGALRFIPLLRKKNAAIEDTQTALGLYRHGNMASNGRNRLRVFSALTSWALENGIVTADSMAARGYTDGKRTYFSPYPFTAGDAVWIAFCLICLSSLITASAAGAFGFGYYPQAAVKGGAAANAAFCALYAVMCFLPAAIQIKEAARWKYLISKT